MTKTGQKSLAEWLRSDIHCPFVRADDVREIAIRDDGEPQKIYAEIVASISGGTNAIILRDTRAVSDFADVALRTRRLLDALQMNEYERGGVKPLRYSSPYWALRIADRKMYSLAFSSIYDREHPRCSKGYADYCMLLLPDTAFEQFRQEGVIPQRLKFNTRQVYHQRGRPYDPNLSELILEAMKIVKPIDPLGEGLPWWNIPETL